MKKKTLMIPVEVDAEVFAQDLAHNMSYDEALNIIKIIDIQIADWAFTKQLAAFFIGEVLDSWWEMEEDLFELRTFLKQNLPQPDTRLAKATKKLFDTF